MAHQSRKTAEDALRQHVNHCRRCYQNPFDPCLIGQRIASQARQELAHQRLDMSDTHTHCPVRPPVHSR